MSEIRYIITAVILFLNFNAVFADEKPIIFESKLNFTPRLGGYFQSGNRTSYYFIGNRNISILNHDFAVVSSINASPDVTVVDFADINGDKYDDLLELRRTEILVRYQRPNLTFSDPVRLISGYFISPPGTQKIEQISLAKDFNHDGFSDIVVASDYHYDVYENIRGYLSKKKSLDCPYESTYSDRYWSNSDIRAERLLSKTYVPSVSYRDLNQDGVEDLFCRYKTIVHYYLSSKDERGVLIPLSQWVTKTYPVDLSREYASSFRLEDMDYDGNLDAVYSIVSGLGIKVKADIYVFWGKQGLPDSSDFFRWTEKGGIFTPLFLDNLDKKQLLAASLSIGVPFFLSYLVEKKIKLDGNVYSFNAVRKLEKVAVHEISFPVIDNYYPGFTVGDFNHDGYSDVAISNDPQEILIHYGSESMSAKNKLMINLMGYGIMKTVVSVNGKNEILIYLPRKINEFDPRTVYLIKFS